MGIVRSLDGHSIFYKAQNSTDDVSIFPNGTRGDIFIEFHGRKFMENRYLTRSEVQYLIVALQQHLEETKDGTPWWEMSRDGSYPNAAEQEAG